MSGNPTDLLPFRRPGVPQTPGAARPARTDAPGDPVVVAFPSDAVRRPRPPGAGSAAFEAYLRRARPSFWQRALLPRCW